MIPAVSYGGQLHGQHIGELPLTAHYLDQVNLDLRRGIFKLEVSGQHTAGHIRQLGHLRIAQHHLGIQNHEGTLHGLLRIKGCIQRTGAVLAHHLVIDIDGICTLPTGILGHIFPALFQGLICLDIGSINIRIHRSRNYIQVIQIEFHFIFLSGAVAGILELDAQRFCAVHIRDQLVGRTHSAQREEDLCPLTCFCKLSAEIAFLAGPVQHHREGLIVHSQLELNILLHGVIDPEGNNGIVPDLICKKSLCRGMGQFHEDVAPIMGFLTAKLHLQGGGGIFALNVLLIGIHTLGNTGVRKAQQTAGLIQIVQRICSHNGADGHLLGSGFLTTGCSNGHLGIVQRFGNKAQIYHLNGMGFHGVGLGGFIQLLLHIASSCAVSDTILHINDLSQIIFFKLIGFGKHAEGAHTQRWPHDLHLLLLLATGNGGKQQHAKRYQKDLSHCIFHRFYLSRFQINPSNHRLSCFSLWSPGSQ